MGKTLLNVYLMKLSVSTRMFAIRALHVDMVNVG